MRKKEARTGIAGQGGGRGRADARQGRQRSHAIPGPLNFSQYFWELLYVYLQSEINIKISAAAPKDYMAVVLHQCETGESVYGRITDLDHLKQNLEENCIPEGFAQMGIEDYPHFLEQRRILMAQKIRKFYEVLK